MDSQRTSQQRSRIPTRKQRETSSDGLRARTNVEGKKKAAWSSGTTLSRTVGPKELKENIVPTLSSKGPQEQRVARKPTKSYMELTRQNKELLSELELLHQDAESRNSQHVNTMDRLSQEILELKEVQAKLRQENESYRASLLERNEELAALRFSVEEMKFENERLAFILEGAKVDVATGGSIDQSSKLASQRQHLDMEFEGHNKELDVFMQSLESTITKLKSSTLHSLRQKDRETQSHVSV